MSCVHLHPMSVALVQSLSTIHVPFSFIGYFSIVLARFQVVCAVSWAILQDLYDFFHLFVCVLFPHYFRVYKSCTSLLFESDFPRSISHSFLLRARIALRRLKKSIRHGQLSRLSRSGRSCCFSHPQPPSSAALQPSFFALSFSFSHKPNVL